MCREAFGNRIGLIGLCGTYVHDVYKHETKSKEFGAEFGGGQKNGEATKLLVKNLTRNGQLRCNLPFIFYQAKSQTKLMHEQTERKRALKDDAS